MIVEETPRLGLPLLVAGQGQKDVTHNEALLLVDALVGACAESRSVAVPPAADAGKAWLVPPGAVGAWAGREGMLAFSTDGGWRFAALAEGQGCWVSDEGVTVRRTADGLVVERALGPAVSAPALPTGGAVVDEQARLMLEALVATLIQTGILAPPDAAGP